MSDDESTDPIEGSSRRETSSPISPDGRRPSSPMSDREQNSRTSAAHERSQADNTDGDERLMREMSEPMESSQEVYEPQSQTGADNSERRQMSLPLNSSQEVDEDMYDYSSNRPMDEEEAEPKDDDTKVQPSLPLESSQLIDDTSMPGLPASNVSEASFVRPPLRRFHDDGESSRMSVVDEASRGSILEESSRLSYNENSRMSSDNPRRIRFGMRDDVSEKGSPVRRLKTSGQETQGSSLIWGTQVDAFVCRQQFRNFLHDFGPDEYGTGHYLNVLESIATTKEYNLNINMGDHLYEYDGGRLYKLVVQYPTEMIPLMDLVVHEEYTQRYPDDDLDSAGIRIQVRLYNLRDKKKMRDLNPENIDQLVSIEGMIIRCSPIVPDMKMGLFRCQICNHEVEVALERNRIQEPRKCSHCATPLSYRLVHNRCLFADKQTVKIQETPENVSEGETPHTCTVLAHDSLVDVCKPGDRVTLTGIYRAMAVRVDPRKRTVMAVYKTHLDVLHVRRKQHGKLRDATPLEDAGSREVNRTFHETDHVMSNSARLEDETKFREMAQSPTLYEDLAKSLAPSIYELLDVKKGLLLQMMGGTNTRSFSEESADTLIGQKATRTRGEINILLCGDPGTSKSQLLSYVHRVAPRGIYTSGKGSSAVGLTAYITKDPDSKELVLESGALVLSDRGVCCIDEFDKMNDATRAILHEVMEQQTISLAKAGIICTLNARTSILASANPVGSRYDPRISVVENLKLPPTLLSRFDLIYLILDKSDADSDRKLARHLVQLYRSRPERKEEVDERLYDLETLAKYVAYAKETCRPKISDRAKKKLVEAYVEMRRLGNMGGGGKRTIVATPRQLESFVRLAEAKAKLRLSDEVTSEDVDEAIRLFNVATHKAAMDPRTGTIDMDAITTGIGSVQRLAEQSLVEFLKNLIQEQHSRGDVLNRRSFLDKLNARPNVKHIELGELDKAFEMLSREQVIVMGAGGAIRVC